MVEGNSLSNCPSKGEAFHDMPKTLEILGDPPDSSYLNSHIDMLMRPTEGGVPSPSPHPNPAIMYTGSRPLKLKNKISTQNIFGTTWKNNHVITKYTKKLN